MSVRGFTIRSERRYPTCAMLISLNAQDGLLRSVRSA